MGKKNKNYKKMKNIGQPKAKHKKTWLIIKIIDHLLKSLLMILNKVNNQVHNNLDRKKKDKNKLFR